MGENICKDIHPIRGQYSKHIKTHTTQKRKKKTKQTSNPSEKWADLNRHLSKEDMDGQKEHEKKKKLLNIIGEIMLSNYSVQFS